MGEQISQPPTDDRGFTLIELLVVMVIVGILVGIAIPLFLSQRAKAEDSAAKSDVTTLGKELATYFVDGTVLPQVSESGEWYSVNGELVSVRSDNVRFGGTGGSTTSDWCVYVFNLQGQVAATGYSYSALDGLEPGTC